MVEKFTVRHVVVVVVVVVVVGGSGSGSMNLLQSI